MNLLHWKLPKGDFFARRRRKKTFMESLLSVVKFSFRYERMDIPTFNELSISRIELTANWTYFDWKIWGLQCRLQCCHVAEARQSFTRKCEFESASLIFVILFLPLCESGMLVKSYFCYFSFLSLFWILAFLFTSLLNIYPTSLILDLLVQFFVL